MIRSRTSPPPQAVATASIFTPKISIFFETATKDPERAKAIVPIRSNTSGKVNNILFLPQIINEVITTDRTCIQELTPVHFLSVL